MPQKPLPDRDRMDWKGPAAFVNRVKQAAEKALKPLSTYIRDALIEQLVRDGDSREEVVDLLRDYRPPGRPRGRRPRRKEK